MTSETGKLKLKLESLDASLSTLEDAVAPLFEQTLAETTVGLTPIEQAKLQTLVPYVLYDLIFIYLKTKGIDPKTHPVVAELARVKKYFDKISSAEIPDTRPTQLDKGAATRFIKHAIAQSQYSKEPVAEEVQTTLVPVRVTDKMRERAEYEREMKEKGDDESEDEPLEIVDEDEGVVKQDKGKGKAVEPEEEPTPVAGNKRRRPVIDPFAGYGDDVPDESSSVKIPDATEASPKKKKKKQKKEQAVAEAPTSASKTPKKKKKKSEK
ncbi:Nuclear nucleic acid-binding protein C1D [Mycena kentingensis (nom. inval.)]|nr:Nuclear nucleic acid-binding protein C1D [Mycena kentingensis (nom. inval.)]